MKRYVETNLLTGYLPSFLSTEPSYYFSAADNEFYCPLPTWCDSPPTGNGECAPCVPPSPSPSSSPSITPSLSITSSHSLSHSLSASSSQSVSPSSSSSSSSKGGSGSGDGGIEGWVWIAGGGVILILIAIIIISFVLYRIYRVRLSSSLPSHSQPLLSSDHQIIQNDNMDQ